MTRNFSLKHIPFTMAALIALTGCNSDNATSDSSEPLLEIGAATSADFVAVRIEAENYNNLTDGWTLTSEENIPTITPDPDPPHYSTASGGANVELLPDTRVTHHDQLINGENYWGTPGNGPRLEYNVTIPEPGRYYVYVKAYSTGGEDNGIHVGIDDQEPESGHRIQLCSGKNRWTWSSAQRATTNHCGVTKTIYLDVENAGAHDIVFYAREDGFELDQFILLKDLNPGVTDCYPLLSDKIQCVDVATGDKLEKYVLNVSPTNNGNEVIFEPPTTTAIIDLQLSLSANKDVMTLDEEVQFALDIVNLDDSDTATNVQALVTLPDGLDFISSDICSPVDNQLTCTFSEIPPDNQVSAVFTTSPNIADSLRVDAQVSATQPETTLGNNTDSSNIVVSVAIPDYDGALSIFQGPNALGLNSSSTHLVSISNKGQLAIKGAALEISANSAVIITSTDQSCSGEPTLSCLPASIQPGNSISIPITLSGVNTGYADITTELIVNGDEDTSNNMLQTAVYVNDGATITDDNGVITVEAESFTAQQTPNASPQAGAYNSAWFVISDTLSPTVSPDFDTMSAEATSNGSYVEFLPDTRVGSADPIFMDVSNYQNGGDSSVLSYDVFFNSTGRYYLAALIRANNNQDASVHLGVNNQWPEASKNLSVCTPDGEWQWTNTIACGSENVAYFDVTTPGMQTIHLSAATDGVEVDKLSLSFNLQKLPSGKGSDPVVYAPQNIDLAITNTLSEGVYTVMLTNLDQSSTAVDIIVQLSGIDVSKAETIAGFDGCKASAELIECNVDYITANNQRSASVSTDRSETEITATLISENDSAEINNKTTTIVTTGGGLIDLFLLLLMTSSLYAIRFFSLKLQRTNQL